MFMKELRKSLKNKIRLFPIRRLSTFTFQRFRLFDLQLNLFDENLGFRGSTLGDQCLNLSLCSLKLGFLHSILKP